MRTITYNSTSNRWNFRENRGEVKVYGIGDIIPESYAGVKASTYMEAFQLLTGQPYSF